MDYAQQQRNPTKHLVGLGVVVVFHIVLVWALVNGLARKVIEVVKGPLETKIIQEVKPPPPEAPPPPPPKLAPPPPDFIPPPEVDSTVVSIQPRNATDMPACDWPTSRRHSRRPGATSRWSGGLPIVPGALRHRRA